MVILNDECAVNLRQVIAGFVNINDAIPTPQCFGTNGGIFEVVFSGQNAIVFDKLTYASLVDGIRLSKATPPALQETST